jgi:hypothetical protein
MDLIDFFQTMINPEDLPPERIPDNHGAMSAVFKTPYVVDLPYSGLWNASTRTTDPIDDEEKTPSDGASEVILVPGTRDCYFHTLGVAAPLWPDAAPVDETSMVPILSTHPVETDHITNFGGKPAVSLAQGLRTHGDMLTTNVCSLPKLDNVGHFWHEISIENNTGTDEIDLRVGFVNKGLVLPGTTEVEIAIVLTDGSIVFQAEKVGTYSSLGSGSVDNFINFNIASTGLDCVAFTVNVTDTDPSSHWIYAFQAISNLVSLPARSATAFLVTNAPEMDDLSQTQSERTSALTGLLTYMGSTLADGGRVSAARLGMGLSPLRAPSGDPYSYLASLPFYNDDYALREGIYAWWLPDSTQEHFYVPYGTPRSDNLEEQSVLHFAILRDEPLQGVRLKVVQNLEVITRSRLYTSETGPINPAYSTVISAIKTIPAVTINSKHVGILQRALGGIRSWLSRPRNWKLLISKGSKILSKLLPGSVISRAAGGLNSLVN